VHPFPMTAGGNASPMPSAPQEPQTHARRRLLVAAAVVAILALRKHDSITNPQFWAEDGGLFFTQAEHLRSWLLLTPYEGYLHLVPRLLAVLARNLPMIAAPALYAWAPLVLTGLAAWGIQSPRVPLPGTAAAALAIALVPHTGEVYLTTCNLQWILAIGLFALAICRDPANWRQGACDLLLLGVLGLTGPFIAAAFPLFAWRAWHRRTLWSAALFAFAIVVLAIQAPSMLAYRPAPHHETFAVIHGVAVISQRILVSVAADHVSLGEAVCAFLGFAVPGCLAWILWRRRQALPGGLELMAAGMLTMAASLYKVRFDTWNFDDLYNGDRYMFLHKVLLVWVVAAVAATSAPAVRRVLASAALAAFLISLPRFLIPGYPDLHWRRYAERIDKGERVVVPILPEGYTLTYPGGRPPNP